MAKKPKETKKDEFAELRERFTVVSDMWNDDRKRYKEDMHFLHVDHWPEGVRSARASDPKNPRLCLEIDQLSQYLRQVVNDSRQNRPQIKVRPVDDMADIETAKVFDGLCRHWQEASNADTCYDLALECATQGGFGYFRILHDYLHDGTFDQDLFFAPIANPLTVYFGDHTEVDGSDVKEVWIVEEIPKAEYERDYPGKATTSWEGEGSKYGDWCGEKIRVAELYEMKSVPRLMHMLEDGSICSDDDYQNAVKNGAPAFPIKASREIPKKTLFWSKFNGAEYLEDPREEPGDRIPVFPVWGNVHNVDGKVIRSSMIHKSRDAQLLYDYSQTAFAERVGQSPEAPWVAAEGQTAGYEDEWDGTRSVRVQHYKPISLEGQAVQPPQRQNPSDIPAGFAQTMQMAEHGIQTTLGMYSASIGKKGNATSGVQEQEQAHRGDVSSFHYHDNLARSIRSAGRYCVSAAPKIIDTARVVRILGIDGQAENVQLDPGIKTAFQKQGKQSIFNIGVGTYDVAVDVGPSYQTSRQASAAGMLALAQADPTMWQTHGDLIAEAQDWPEAQRFAERSKLLLPPPVIAAEQAKKEQSPEVAQVKMMAEQVIQQKDEIMQAASQEIETLRQENQKLVVAAQQAGLKAQKTEVQAAQDALNSNYKIADLNLRLDEQQAVEKVNQMANSQQEAADAKEESDGAEILAALTEIGTAIQVGIPEQIAQANMEVVEKINTAVEALLGVVMALAQPKHKTATAVKHGDKWVLESVETNGVQQ